MSPFMQKIVNQFPQDLKEAFEERCAIMEFHGRQPRHFAERNAFVCYIDDKTKQQFEDSISCQASFTI